MIRQAVQRLSPVPCGFVFRFFIPLFCLRLVLERQAQRAARFIKHPPQCQTVFYPVIMFAFSMLNQYNIFILQGGKIKNGRLAKII